MPSRKPKVVSYLDDSTKAVFDRFCDDNDYSNSEGVAYLIKQQLVEKKSDGMSNESQNKCSTRIASLEKRWDSLSAGKFALIRKLEHQGELIAILQCEVERLKNELTQSAHVYYHDEEIASVTGRREQEVYEWRMGLRKPRGKRILEKLNDYEVRDGRWVKKQVECEDRKV